MEMQLPAPYVARPYRGAQDHQIFASVLSDYNRYSGASEQPTVEQFDVTYANLTNCDPATDIMVIEADDGEAVGYVRVSWEEIAEGHRDGIVFCPIRPSHLDQRLFTAVVAAQERHLHGMSATHQLNQLRAYAPHPGPGVAPTMEAAWLESLGYRPIRFGASLVRPHMDDIPDLPLPEGVEVRPVQPSMIRQIWDADVDAFRGSWDFHEPSEEDFTAFVDNPLRDESLWKVAWAGDAVIGQVKSYINHDENERMGYRRGYTEEIATHIRWRRQGVAGALLAMSLRELRDRGMTEAALGVDTENPGGAFALYTRLGFELRAYEAVYTKSMPRAAQTAPDAAAST